MGSPRSPSHAARRRALLIAACLFGGTWLPAQGQTPENIEETAPALVEAAIRDEPSATEDTVEFIETDRNSFTFAPVTAGAGRVIFESAYSFLKFGNEGAKSSFPESVLRVGMGNRWELRLGYNFETGGAAEAAEGDLASGNGINAAQQFFYGFKYQVSRQVKESPLRPNSAFLAQAHTPVASAESHTQLRVGYAWGWIFSNGWTFDSGIRYGTDREFGDNYTIWSPSTVVKIPLGREKRWFTHLEYFSLMSQGKEHDFSKQFLDSGLHFFLTPDWEIGAIIGFGINEQSQGILINTGFGRRF